MKVQLAGQPLKFQSVYPFDSAPQFVKQIEQMSQKSCFTIIRRSINTKSKLGKRKTCKAVAARFLRTGKGKLKRWRTGKSHKMMHKGPKRSRHLRKPTYVNKQQLKLLNKMLNGWWNCILLLISQDLNRNLESIEVLSRNRLLPKIPNSSHQLLYFMH